MSYWMTAKTQSKKTICLKGLSNNPSRVIKKTFRRKVRGELVVYTTDEAGSGELHHLAT